MGASRFIRILTGFVLVLYISCSSDNGEEEVFDQRSEEQVMLSVEIVPEGSGVVIPKSGTFNKGEEIVLRAIPNEYYFFSHWEGGLTSGEESYPMVMNSDLSVIAVFYETYGNPKDQR